MPTAYRPECNYLHFETDSFESVAAALRRSVGEIAAAYGKCGWTSDDEYLEWEIVWLEQHLFRVVSIMAAHPLRTPRHLLSTVKKIVRCPENFLENYSGNSPEAAGLVLLWYRHMFPHKDRDVLLWEIGQAELSAEGIKLAAKAAQLELETDAKNAGRGRPKMELSNALAANLATHFLDGGGHVGRTVHDKEGGPFHSYLTAVLSAVKPLVLPYGYTLNIETMVRHARDVLQESGRIPTEKSPINSHTAGVGGFSKADDTIQHKEVSNDEDDFWERSGAFLAPH